MTQKEIEDGADSIILTELDDAAEARIIDVLSKVFATNRYPGLKAAITASIVAHQRNEEAAQRKQVDYLKEIMNKQTAGMYQKQTSMQEHDIIRKLREQELQKSSRFDPPFSSALDKPFKNW